MPKSNEFEDIIQQLTSLELKILPELAKISSVSDLMKKTGLKDVEVLRAAQWLSNKELIELKKEESESVDLDTNGKNYAKNGLPEKQILKLIEKKTLSKDEIVKSVSDQELNASMGILKRYKTIDIKSSDKGLMFSITEQGAEFLKKETPTELFLKKKFPLEESSLNVQDKFVLKDLLSRKNILRKDKKTAWFVTLTAKGKEIAKLVNSSDIQLVEKLTPKMIKSGSWKNQTFRAFDIKSKVPQINRGRKHFVNEAIEYIKSIWLELGFEEMSGTFTQSAFWDLDSLFVPQDHPAREEQDTFYIEGKAKLPKELLKKVSLVHENGADTGSKGWQTPFSKEITEQILLRTHTTVLSAQTIANLKKEDLPMKFFSVNKVFRNEAVDWKHLFQFNQVEGIVVDPDGNMSKLKGYLKEFFGKMGFTDVRIRPAYFPYTEPSAEIEVFHPVKKEWIEMGGCGIFRPEVTKTLMGFECPVLAWGLGMERIIVQYYNLTDLRDLYKNDIEQIRNMKSFMK